MRKNQNQTLFDTFDTTVTVHTSSSCSDGKLKEADQILAINGQSLDQTVTHQQAIGILQSASERVKLTVARGPIPQLASPMVSRTPSAASTLSTKSSAVVSEKTTSALLKHSFQNVSSWTNKISFFQHPKLQHVETIELVNDGTGLGFGIVGGKTTGVIVKTILPGGIADQVMVFFLIRQRAFTACVMMSVCYSMCSKTCGCDWRSAFARLSLN